MRGRISPDASKSVRTWVAVSAFVNNATSHTWPANCRPTPAGVFVYCGSHAEHHVQGRTRPDAVGRHGSHGAVERAVHVK